MRRRPGWLLFSTISTPSSGAGSASMRATAFWRLYPRATSGTAMPDAPKTKLGNKIEKGSNKEEKDMYRMMHFEAGAHPHGLGSLWGAGENWVTGGSPSYP